VPNYRERLYGYVLRRLGEIVAEWSAFSESVNVPLLHYQVLDIPALAISLP
jgi:hypothetical protein